MKPQTLCFTLGYFTEAMLAFLDRWGYSEVEVTFLIWNHITAAMEPLGVGQMEYYLPREA